MRYLGNDVVTVEKLHEMERRLVVARQTIEALTAHNVEIEQQLNMAHRREAEARESAYYDELTGLPNRRLLNDRLQQEMARTNRQHNQVVLLLIDLDRFKAINDTFGHAAGDQLLCEVSTRLVKCIRASDTACRHGGDEFIVIMPELKDMQALEKVTNKIRACLEKPYLICGRELFVGASIGRAVYPADGTTGQRLIEKADADMYRIKAMRKQ
ncbi:MAG: diguanylate cyclase domain-containing protein [Burkholderiaceae bacterium]